MTLFRTVSHDAFLRIVLRPWMWHAVRSLRRSDIASAVRAADAVTATFAGTISGDEWTEVSKIEMLRGILERSEEQLEVTDYGARATSAEGIRITRTLGDVAKRCSKSPLWALLLFHLVRRTASVRCLEFGTCVGISALYQSAALELNGTGTLVTMEGSETLAQVARRNFEQLRRSLIVQRIGRFQEILVPVLNEFGPFDLVFIDGHHDGEATERYFTTLLPSLNRHAVVVIDDIRWSAGMRSAWQRMQQHPRTAASAGLIELGIIIVT